MDKTIIIAIALGILVIVAGLQAYQLFSLKSKLADSGVKLGSATSGIATTAGSSQAPAADALPSMVGGC